MWLFRFVGSSMQFSVLYRLIIQRLRLYQSQMIKIGLLMIIGGASMFTMFATFRCITFLTVPTLSTYPGRLFLNAVMIQNILEGNQLSVFKYYAFFLFFCRITSNSVCFMSFSYITSVNCKAGAIAG